MASTKSKPSGALGDHDSTMRHHRRAWVVERIGWTTMALLLGATLLGLFGDGPLSRAREGSAQVRIEYDRLVRSSAPNEYRFRVDAALVEQGLVRLRIENSLAAQMELDSILPEPEHAIAGPGYVEYVFRAVPGAAPVQIDIRYRPATFGRHAGRVWVNGQRFHIDQFAYP